MIGPYLSGPNDTPENGVYQGDARELAAAIPNESVAMLMTDPPYDRTSLPLYEFAAREGARVLKPGSWAFFYGGATLEQEILSLLSDKGLDYFMMIALYHDNKPRLWSKKLMVAWKPVFSFTKGPPTILKWQSNMFAGDKRRKVDHKWEQGIYFPLKKIEMFTRPGDVVLDFFGGGGTTAVAALMLGRRYLLFEQDAAAVTRIRARLATTTRPFPFDYPEYEQGNLLSEASTPPPSTGQIPVARD